MAWQAACIILGVLLIGGVVGYLLSRADERGWSGGDDFPDSRFDPDIVGDHPHIPDDYGRELHQDPQRAWPENGEPRGA